MGLDILFIPSRPYNPFPLSTLLNLCIKNEDILGSFGIFYPETKRNNFYISGTRKETALKKRIFTFLEMFGNENKKRKFKKPKRHKNV